MQPSEGQLHLRLHTGHPDRPAPHGPPGQVIKQKRLAHTRLAAHHQGLSLTRPHASHEPVQDGTFSLPVNQSWPAAVASRGCHHRPGSPSRPGRRHHIRARRERNAAARSPRRGRASTRTSSQSPLIMQSAYSSGNEYGNRPPQLRVCTAAAVAPVNPETQVVTRPVSLGTTESEPGHGDKADADSEPAARSGRSAVRRRRRTAGLPLLRTVWIPPLPSPSCVPPPRARHARTHSGRRRARIPPRAASALVSRTRLG
jgi:hypothetical protein